MKLDYAECMDFISKPHSWNPIALFSAGSVWTFSGGVRAHERSRAAMGPGFVIRKGNRSLHGECKLIRLVLGQVLSKATQDESCSERATDSDVGGPSVTGFPVN